MMTKEEFVRQAYAAAAKSSERSGMPAMVTVAQAALESNWGKSRLSQEAQNYFGIKARGKQERIRMCTHECVHPSASTAGAPGAPRFLGTPARSRAGDNSRESP